MLEIIDSAINQASRGSLLWCDEDFKNLANSIALKALESKQLEKEDIENLYGILFLSNILYNNTTREYLPLEDGVYDLCISKYNNLTNGQAPVGAPPIVFETSDLDIVKTVNEQVSSNEMIEVYKNIDFVETDTSVIDRNLFYNHPITSWYADDENWSLELQAKKSRSKGHMYPSLTGTLDKCKFVTLHDAARHGISPDDYSVGIFERDFMHAIRSRGLNIDMLIVEIKYDGVSVELVVNGDTVIEAYSRGDTKNNEAADLTPIFGGLTFPNARGKVDKGTVFGIKCECIITYDNLMLLSKEFGRTYKNPRNAVTGLIGSLDGRKYMKYLTLIPIRTAGLDIDDRTVDIEFLNTYYSLGMDLKYWILQGSYESILYQARSIVNELENARPYMPYMYDGVVISSMSPAVKQIMGRVNSVDKWSIAVKFNSQVKETVFTGYSYSVGQNGIITPKAHFRPVEFLGTIHTNTTAHSYQRFKQLGLRIGDIVSIEYRNDVICYINKPDNAYNQSNPNPVEQFPEYCPSCGTKLIFTEKSASCPNVRCPGRNLGRIVNMLAKLNIKDFSTAYIEALGISSLTELISYDINKAKSILGDVIGDKFGEKISQLMATNYPDYRIVGSIGFSSVAQEKWKLILKELRLESIINMGSEELYNTLYAMKGIGPVTAKTIVEERDNYLLNDLVTISTMPNVYRTFGSVEVRPEVRFTGVRDSQLEEMFNSKGFDADGKKTVTKKTAILIVPYMGFTSSKTSKVSPQCMIMSPEMARDYIGSL